MIKRIINHHLFNVLKSSAGFLSRESVISFRFVRKDGEKLRRLSFVLALRLMLINYYVKQLHCISCGINKQRCTEIINIG